MATITINDVDVFGVEKIGTAVSETDNRYGIWQRIAIEHATEGEIYYPRQVDTEGWTESQWVRVEAIDSDGEVIASAEAWWEAPE